MAVVEGRSMLELLNPNECWDRVADAPIGRIAVIVDGAPEIYPINFALDAGTVVFRTAIGSKLRGLDRSPSVAMEVDGIEPLSRTGWSVLIKGRATVITDPEEVRRALTLDLEVWAPGMKTRWIRLTPREITGRGIRSTGGLR